ncbi:hypothetical protein [Pseudoxanthomonas daejeonensis]|uniref:hypothetical protein n=1 Tax=Pseudoxanthomonas daejeonensis TaxID=266062 RepID=UPI001EE48CDF|nr:hypothetical protein [Pseudoxanthomonas daejeonensis]
MRGEASRSARSVAQRWLTAPCVFDASSNSAAPVLCDLHSPETRKEAQNSVNTHCLPVRRFRIAEYMKTAKPQTSGMRFTKS